MFLITILISHYNTKDLIWYISHDTSCCQKRKQVKMPKTLGDLLEGVSASRLVWSMGQWCHQRPSLFLSFSSLPYMSFIPRPPSPMVTKWLQRFQTLPLHTEGEINMTSAALSGEWGLPFQKMWRNLCSHFPDLHGATCYFWVNPSCHVKIMGAQHYNWGGVKLSIHSA